MDSPTTLPWIPAPTVTLDTSIKGSARYASLPDEVRHATAALFELMRLEAPPNVGPIGQLVALRTRGRFNKEARAIAETLEGVTWRELMLANASYDMVLTAFGCSTVVAESPRGPVLARNMDWWPERELARASCLLRLESDGRLVNANAGWPGAIGVVSGMSGRGFGLVLNAVSCAEGPNVRGYPVLYFLRRVIDEATGFADAVERLSPEPLMSPCLITVVGTENDERVVVERTPTRHALRWGAPGTVLITTNDYRSLVDSGGEGLRGALTTSACGRYDALCDLAQEIEPEHVDDVSLLYALTDANVLQGITAQHVILRPRDGHAALYIPSRLAS